MLYRLILTTASAIALTAAASAADMYSGGFKDGSYAVNWSGLYIGANGGYGWADSDTGINGGFGGGQIGYNFQRGKIVLGAEADIEGSDIAGSGSATLDYFGTVRGRIGYAFGRTLVFGTGGYGYGGLSGDGASNITGWVAGGGLEYKFTPAWAVKAEYQYMETTNSPAGDSNVGIDAVRLGVNYFVGGGHDPLK